MFNSFLAIEQAWKSKTSLRSDYKISDICTPVSTVDYSSSNVFLSDAAYLNRVCFI